MSSFNEQLKNLQGEIDSLLQARSSSLAQIRTLDQKVKAAEARAEAAERTLGGVQGATAHVRELQHQLQLSEDKNETLSTQLQEAEERLRLERQGAKTRVQELLEASKKQQKLNDVLEERSQQLTRKLHELEREHMELAARFKASIGAESEATTRQLLEAREQLTEMRSQLESERETWKRLDKELDDLRAKYRRLKTQYDRREGLVKSALESLMAIQVRLIIRWEFSAECSFRCFLSFIVGEKGLGGIVGCHAIRRSSREAVAASRNSMRAIPALIHCIPSIPM